MSRWNIIKIIASSMTIIVIICGIFKTLNKYMDGHDGLNADFIYYTSKTDKKIDVLQKEINNNTIDIKYIQRIMEKNHDK